MTPETRRVLFSSKSDDHATPRDLAQRLAFRGGLFVKTKTDLQRFMEKVLVQSGAGCWLWTAGLDKDGYGKFAVGPHRKQKHYRAHKWIVGAGAKDVVMHVCDTPRCVRPEHLRIGTQAENRADCVSKQRQARGSGHPKSRLTEDQVREIRLLHKSGAKSREIASTFGIHRATVFGITSGRNWAHVT